MSRLNPGTRLTVGVLGILVALLVFAAGRLVAAGQRHAYDPGATPPSTYQLTAGKTYYLASGHDLATLRKTVDLSQLACDTTTGSGPARPVTIVSTRDDDRSLNTFATVTVAVNGRVQISCTGIPEVFVDNADDAGFDYGGLSVLLATLLGALATIIAVSAGYQLGQQRAA